MKVATLEHSSTLAFRRWPNSTSCNEPTRPKIKGRSFSTTSPQGSSTCPQSGLLRCEYCGAGTGQLQPIDLFPLHIAFLPSKGDGEGCSASLLGGCPRWASRKTPSGHDHTVDHHRSRSGLLSRLCEQVTCGEHPSVARHCGSRNCLFCPWRRLIVST